MVSGNSVWAEETLPLTGRSQELALTERTPAKLPHHQGACDEECTPELAPALGRLFAICLAQQAAQ